MYGDYYTPQTISNFTKVIKEQVQYFKQRSPAQQYAIVYLDATYCYCDGIVSLKKRCIWRSIFKLMDTRKS